ncbi:MAG: hypothetical protein ACI8RZ_001050 [Myxococcota bacterium]|jgi:hypothetical protein
MLSKPSNAATRLSISLRRVVCFWLVTACNGTTNTTNTTTVTDTGSDTSALQSTFSVSCDEDSLDVSIYRGRDQSWWMGMAVTDPRAEVWTGEDCFIGDTLDGEAVLYCHPLNDSRTTLTFGADPLTLIPGEQTALIDSDICESLTFYFFETTTLGCWVAGHTPDYYAGLCDNQVSLQ